MLLFFQIGGGGLAERHGLGKDALNHGLCLRPADGHGLLNGRELAVNLFVRLEGFHHQGMVGSAVGLHHAMGHVQFVLANQLLQIGKFWLFGHGAFPLIGFIKRQCEKSGSRGVSRAQTVQALPALACCVRPKNADAVDAMPVLFQAGDSDHVGTSSGHPIRGQKRKKPLTNQRLSSFLVRLAGIEPTTLWFVARYSIQLSYSRTDYRLYKQKSSD